MTPQQEFRSYKRQGLSNYEAALKTGIKYKDFRSPHNNHLIPGPENYCFNTRQTKGKR